MLSAYLPISRRRDILLHNHANGSWAMHFDGSDVGSTTDAEGIDSINRLSNGDLLISTRGRVRVGSIQAHDEDLLRFDPSRLGSTTRGDWSLYFDGSDVGLTRAFEDVNGAWLDRDPGSLPDDERRL